MTVEKRYQVFISTTYPDMQPARQALMLPLLDLGMTPMGMDLHRTETNDRMSIVQRMIDDCDYFVILLGGRYGALSPLGLSYIHREYIFAATKRKPVISFIHDQPCVLPTEAREKDREGKLRREDFARLLESKTQAYGWRDERDLSEQVAKVMPNIMQQYPAAGWVKSDTVELSVGSDENARLRWRISELEKEREELLSRQHTPMRDLARGNDQVALDYSCDVFQGGDCKVAMASCELSWNRVFTCLAPLMLNPVAESVMQKALEDYITRRALEDVLSEFSKAHAVRNVMLAGHAFNQVKVHLRALGLIRKALEEDSQGRPFWQLTAQGDKAMSQMMARRR